MIITPIERDDNLRDLYRAACRRSAAIEAAELRASLTPGDVTALCARAAAAWRNGTGRQRMVYFDWRGRRFTSTLSNFRMLVRTAEGWPVACRWGGPDDDVLEAAHEEVQ